MKTVVQPNHKSSVFNYRILFATSIHIYTLAMSCMSEKDFNIPEPHVPAPLSK